MDANTATLGASLVTLATLIVHAYTQSRNRKWDLEDKAREAKATTEHRNKITEEIEKNTDLTSVAVQKADAAYSEANDVNRKIAEIGARIVDKK